GRGNVTGCIVGSGKLCRIGDPRRCNGIALASSAPNLSLAPVSRRADGRNLQKPPALADQRKLEGAMSSKVIAIGLDPSVVDYSAMPQFTPDMFRNYIEAQIERVRSLGYDVTSCLIDLGETAETVTAEALNSQRFDCVLIGAGLRQADRLLLFEKIIN